MISTCAGIDKYAFYLDFKSVLSSKPQVSVQETSENPEIMFHGSDIYHFTLEIKEMKICISFHQYFIKSSKYFTYK
jgi:hypothetical protein